MTRKLSLQELNDKKIVNLLWLAESPCRAGKRKPRTGRGSEVTTLLDLALSGSYKIHMNLSIDGIAQLAAGALPYLEAGRIANQARHHLSQKAKAVYLSSEGVNHILQRHGDHIAPHDLLNIPTILSRGMWVADRERCCQVVYLGPDGAPPVKLALKATFARHEVYISTLHVTNAKKVDRYIRGGEVLRKHL